MIAAQTVWSRSFEQHSDSYASAYDDVCIDVFSLKNTQFVAEAYTTVWYSSSNFYFRQIRWWQCNR